jgi:hypothetical protein
VVDIIVELSNDDAQTVPGNGPLSNMTGFRLRHGLVVPFRHDDEWQSGPCRYATTKAREASDAEHERLRTLLSEAEREERELAARLKN